MITIFTPVEKVTVTNTDNEAAVVKLIETAFGNGGFLSLHSPQSSVFIGPEALKNSVVRVDKDPPSKPAA